MLKIGDFSKLSRVSIRMLRHYDEIGLLKPIEIDRFTGYRYYSEQQLTIANRITALKNMGFGLADISEILSCYDDHEKLEQYLCDKQAELEETKEVVLQKIRLLETAHMKLIPADPCYCSVTYLDCEYKEKDVDIEAQKTVKGQYSDTEHVKFKTVPQVTFASATFKGPYDLIGEVNMAVAEWVKDNGYEFSGPMFNIYHVSPAETSNPDEFITEVCYPVTKK